MPFDLYCEHLHEKIEHHEEDIFLWLEEHQGRFKQLGRIAEQYYQSPTISPKQSEELIHELIQLQVLYKDKKHEKMINKFVLKLLPIMSFSCTQNVAITCHSD